MSQEMLTIYAAEQRGGRIVITTDRDCLPADVIRTSTHVFPNYDAVIETAEMYFTRGFTVTVNTERGVVEYKQ